MKNQTISVIIPVFNTGAFLNKCVESVASQTYRHLEIILIDDGSTDGSENLCDLWASKDSRIKVIHKPNGGLSSARNAGLDVASGEFVAFVDSDDFLEPNMFETLFTARAKADADIVLCSFSMENESGEPYATTPPISNLTLSGVKALELLNQPRQDRFVVAWNKLFTRKLFDDIRFPEGKIHEDQWIAHKLFFEAKTIKAIPGELYHYVVHENSIMQLKNPIKHFDDIDALFDRVQFYQNNNLKHLVAGVENTMCELFGFYKQKMFSFGAFNKNELKTIKIYANKCYAFFKKCKMSRKYSKNERKLRKNTYKFSFLEKIKLKHGNKIKQKVTKWKKI